MSLRLNLRNATAACAVAATVVSGSAFASTINQNTSWTINRSGATGTYRVVAYGDSIFAGYNGSLFSVARRASPYVGGEYLGNQWNANIEVVRRTKSGAKADDIYNNKIVSERSYMQTANTRVVVFEMCGNDYLQARTAFKDQTGTCSYAGLDTALANCTNYTQKAMQTINQYATAAKSKIVMNIYYPGYNSDNVLTACTDPATGVKINRRDKFLPYLAKSNWRTCNLAAQNGFKCADAFAESMAADYDSNGDGQVDTEAIRFRAGESEADYVNRIVSLKSTLRDSNTKMVSATASFDYLQSDDTHQTYFKSTIGTGSGSAAPDFTSAQIVGGKNPEWNKWGHERTGWSLSTYNPAAP